MFNSSKDASLLIRLILATKDANGEKEDHPTPPSQQCHQRMAPHSSLRSSATQLLSTKTPHLLFGMDVLLIQQLLLALSQLVATGPPVKN
jgi:hypothetical protein